MEDLRPVPSAPTTRRPSTPPPFPSRKASSGKWRRAAPTRPDWRTRALPAHRPFMQWRPSSPPPISPSDVTPPTEPSGRSSERLHGAACSPLTLREAHQERLRKADACAVVVRHALPRSVWRSPQALPGPDRLSLPHRSFGDVAGLGAGLGSTPGSVNFWRSMPPISPATGSPMSGLTHPSTVTRRRTVPCISPVLPSTGSCFHTIG